MTHAALLACACLLGTSCAEGAGDVCGLSSALPEVDAGFGAATRSDGEDFNAQASWALGSNASLTVGTLDMIVAKDSTGSDFDTLLEDAAFPFCVPLGARSDTSGNATLNDSPVGVSDASHTGGVAVLALEGDVLVGRFEVDLALNGGGVLSLTDGVFRATQRP